MSAKDTKLRNINQMAVLSNIQGEKNGQYCKNAKISEIMRTTQNKFKTKEPS